MTWSEYVIRTCGDDQGRDFQTKTGIDGSTLSRWRRGDTSGASGLRVDKVAAFARGYNVPVLEAFIEAGFLSPQEANAKPPTKPDLAAITNDELVELVRQRLARAGEGDGRDAPSTNPDGGVTDLSAGRPNLRRVARKKPGSPQE